MEFKEECWIVKGIRIGGYRFGRMVYHSEGTLHSVSFSWEEAFSKTTLGWCHTHPFGFRNPSLRDNRTMHGWSVAIGKPLLCGIRQDGSNKWWLYWRNKKNQQNSEVIRKPIKVFTVLGFICYKEDISLSSESQGELIIENFHT